MLSFWTDCTLILFSFISRLLSCLQFYTARTLDCACLSRFRRLISNSPTVAGCESLYPVHMSTIKKYSKEFKFFQIKLKQKVIFNFWTKVNNYVIVLHLYKCFLCNFRSWDANWKGSNIFLLIAPTKNLRSDYQLKCSKLMVIVNFCMFC